MTVSAWAVKAALLLALAGAAGPTANAPDIAAEKAAMALPLEEGSLRFAVVGDSGTGDAAQVELARKLEEWRAVFPFELVLMLGDNIYGKDDPRDYRRKFEQPYRPLPEAGVIDAARGGAARAQPPHRPAQAAAASTLSSR